MFFLNYIIGYLVAGVIFTMIMEIIFIATNENEEDLKFDNYLERFIAIIFWVPIIVYVIKKKLFH